MSEIPHCSNSDEQAYEEYVGSPGTVHKPPPKRARIDGNLETVRKSTEKLDLEAEPKSIDVFAQSDSQDDYSTAPESQGSEDKEVKQDEVVNDSVEDEEGTNSDASLEIDEKEFDLQSKTPKAKRLEAQKEKGSPSTPTSSGGRLSANSTRSPASVYQNRSDPSSLLSPPSLTVSEEAKASETGERAPSEENLFGSGDDEEEERRFQELAVHEEAMDDEEEEMEEVAHCESPEELVKDSTPTPEDLMSPQGDLACLLEAFDEKQLVFPPNPLLADSFFDSVYAKVPGLENPKFDEHGEQQNLKLFKQEWGVSEIRKENDVHKHQLALLKDYLSQGTDGGYHTFAGLIEDMIGVGSRELRFPALEKWYVQEVESKGNEDVFQQLRNVVHLAAAAEEVLPKKIYYLVEDSSATLSQKQCASLVARMFFNFGAKPYWTPARFEPDEPIGKVFAFQRILRGTSDLAVEKLKFIFNYFDTFSKTKPNGFVSFRRIKGRPMKVDEMKECKNRIRATIKTDMKIEESALSTQVDFANKKLGGGVLTHGAVQEEIRFLMCPEMFVGMLLAGHDMGPDEAISIIGAQAYSSYKGYGATVKWVPLKKEDARQNMFRDEFRRIRIECIAIDAVNFGSANRSNVHLLRQQLQTDALLREINKALVGFQSPGKHFNKIPIVSGWWGCGAFGGDKILKFLIQVIAAGIADRPLQICPFGDQKVAEKCENIINEIATSNITAGKLLELLLRIPQPTSFTFTENFYVYEVLTKLIRESRAGKEDGEKKNREDVHSLVSE